MVPVRGIPAEQAARLLGRRVNATTRADGSTAIVAADGAAGQTASGTTVAAGAQKRVAVILMNFSNDTRQPWTVDQVRANAFDDAAKSVAAYYRQASWGQLQLSGDVFGWYTIPDTNAGCNYMAWASSANAAATAAGVTLSAYDNVVYAFPSTSSCAWSGLAYLPGTQSWLNNAGTSLRTMAHELGHNFGTHHASTLNCVDGGVRVPLSATAANCSSNEYGDPFSVMGAAGKYEHTNYSRGNFGWLQAANTLTATVSGDYPLKPISTYDTAVVQTLRVRRTSSTFLTLELRQPDGSYFDSFAVSDPAVTGVTVRITTDYSSRSQSQLVDTTPGTTSFADAPLQAGQTVVDPLTGVSLTALTVGPSGATVRVAFAPDTAAPTTPASLAAKALDSSRIQLTWGASTDNIGVAGYRILRGSTLLGTVTGTSYTDTGLDPATAYAYQVLAFDAAGNTSPAATAGAITSTIDTQAPTAPSNLTGAVGKGKKASLSWSPSTDNVAVTGYQVLRNGTRIATTSSTSYTDTLSGKSTSATYSVVAVDAAGNLSPPSNSITLKS
jgi:chitodextrinase